MVLEKIGLNRKLCWIICGGEASRYLFHACLSIE